MTNDPAPDLDSAAAAEPECFVPAPRSHVMAVVHQMLRDRPEPAPWRRVHDSAVCQRCDGPVPTWWTPDWVWRTGVMTTTYHRLCPVCFIALADLAGIGPTGAWQLYPPAALA